MFERIACPNTSTLGQSGSRLEVPNGSSFKLGFRCHKGMSIYDKVADLNRFDLNGVFFIQYKENQGSVEFHKTSLGSSKVYVDHNTGIIKFVFQDYNLPEGDLLGTLEFLFRDPESSTNLLREVVEFDSGITLV